MPKRLPSLMAACAVGILSIAPLAGAQQTTAPNNDYWWPNRLSLSPLRQSESSANPLGAEFDYAKAFAKLDLDAVKKDLSIVMRTSQDWAACSASRR